MKTNKEYPATHSMSTTWFAVDVDGNVAILDFDDNGPVPCDPLCIDSSVDEVLCEQMAANAKERYAPIHYTKSQIDEIMTKSVQIPEEMMSWSQCVIVQIDSQKFDAFDNFLQEVFKEDLNFGSGNVYTLDKERGIYCMYNLYFGNTLQDKFVNGGFVLRYYIVNTSLDVDCTKQSISFQNDIENFPFYVYKQEYWGEPYSSSNYLFRASKPKYPFKFDQLPKESQGKAIRIPLRFEDSEKFAIDEFCECNRYFQGVTVTVDGESGYELVRLTNGKMGCVKSADPPQVYEMEDVRQNHQYQIDCEDEINGVKGFIFAYQRTYVNVFTGEEYEPTEDDEVKRVHPI